MSPDANAQVKRDNNPKSSAQNGVNKKKKKKNKNKNKHAVKNTHTGHPAPQTQGAKPKALSQLPPPSVAPSSSKKKGGSLLDQMRQKLQGGQFRWLNEQLYTTAGDNALSLMRKNPELYDKYHEGFREQTKGWPLKPVDVAIKWLKSRPPNWKVADLGCGDATLAKAVSQKVHSFDLVASVPGVIACNMSELPLQKESIDVAVFCLSLMGTDYGEFLEEAARVLNQSGWIWIAEVQSRFVDASGRSVLKEFIAAVSQLGFTLRKQDASNSHFLLLEFQGKKGRNPGPYLLQWPSLRACQYKKR